MERDLPGLTHRATKDQESNPGGDSQPQGRGLSGQLVQSRFLQTTGTLMVEQEGARLRIKPDHPQQQPQVTNPRRDERLLSRRRRARLLIPESDQEVRSQADQFPTNEQ